MFNRKKLTRSMTILIVAVAVMGIAVGAMATYVWKYTKPLGNTISIGVTYGLQLQGDTGGNPLVNTIAWGLIQRPVDNPATTTIDSNTILGYPLRLYGSDTIAQGSVDWNCTDANGVSQLPAGIAVEIHFSSNDALWSPDSGTPQYITVLHHGFSPDFYIKLTITWNDVIGGDLSFPINFNEYLSQ